jgi:hypothetical protein
MRPRWVQVLGRIAADDGSGRVHVFQRSLGLWSRTAELTASVPAFNDFFGHALSMSGDTALVADGYLDDPALQSVRVVRFVDDPAGGVGGGGSVGAGGDTGSGGNAGGATNGAGAADGVGGDSGATNGAGAADDEGAATDDGCGCRTAGDATRDEGTRGLSLVALIGAGLLWRRSRRFARGPSSKTRGRGSVRDAA